METIFWQKNLQHEVRKAHCVRNCNTLIFTPSKSDQLQLSYSQKWFRRFSILALDLPKYEMNVARQTCLYMKLSGHFAVQRQTDRQTDPQRYTLCSIKNQAPWCLIITLANVDQFSKFFHQVIRKKILYVISTSPAIYCYTTLWKSKIQKCYWLWQHLNTVLTYSCEHFEDLI